MTDFHHTLTSQGQKKLLDMISLVDEVVVVTGASSGIGRAAAQIYAEAGATVVILGRNQARLREVESEIKATGGRVYGYVADLAETGAADTVFEKMQAEVGKPTIVVANAGIAGGGSYRTAQGSIERYTNEEWERVLETNLTGTFEVMRAAARVLTAGGRILVTSSTAGLRTDPMVSYAYVASKAGIINLAKQMALELAPRNINVNVIAPGPFKGTRIGGDAVLDEEGERDWKRTIPLSRMGTMDEIQGPMLFLVSPSASFLTGAVLAVDGGALALSHPTF